MWRALSFFLLGCLPVASQVAPIPTPTQLPGTPFFIQKNWFIGGTGNWDYLTIDPAAQRLYIAHGHSVQVVDLDSGSLAGEISGFREAHAIALDDTGTYGYVSDGPAGAVKVFNRQTLNVENTIPVACSPRSIAFEAQSKLVFAVCGASIVPPGSAPRLPRPGAPSDRATFTGLSRVVVIDTGIDSAIADILIDGDFRFAQPDLAGHVFITVGTTTERRLDPSGNAYFRSTSPRIARIDAVGLPDEAHRHRDGQSDPTPGEPVPLDWSDNRDSAGLLHFIPLPNSCDHPQGVAVDSRNQRLFTACEDQQLLVLDANNGHVVTTLTTGPGDDVIGYDADRNLIYSANGGGYGSLTIIRQDTTADTYAVIQNLPTLARARTLAVDPSTGDVYLVTDVAGVDLSPRGAFNTIKSAPIPGSFQVLVVGH
jgi:DNA-binding beta-propeller fold protein YncE